MMNWNRDEGTWPSWVPFFGLRNVTAQECIDWGLNLNYDHVVSCFEWFSFGMTFMLWTSKEPKSERSAGEEVSKN